MPRRRVLLMIETSLVYGREALRGINRYVVEHEPWSVYLDQRELTAAPPEWFSRWDGDGVISRWTNTDLARTLARRKIPAVDLTDIYGGFGLPHVWANHAAVSELAARHLLERGFHHFAFCGFDNQDWSERRQSGFVESLPVPRKGCDLQLRLGFHPRTDMGSATGGTRRVAAEPSQAGRRDGLQRHARAAGPRRLSPVRPGSS